MSQFPGRISWPRTTEVRASSPPEPELSQRLKRRKDRPNSAALLTGLLAQPTKPRLNPWPELSGHEKPAKGRVSTFDRKRGSQSRTAATWRLGSDNTGGRQPEWSGPEELRLLGNGPGVGVSWIKGFKRAISSPVNHRLQAASIFPVMGSSPAWAETAIWVRGHSGHRARPAPAGAADQYKYAGLSFRVPHW